MTNVLLLAVAGALGTLSRVGLTRALARWNPDFPWGTVAVNLLGSLAFGVLWAATETRGTQAAELRVYFLTGFLGAFTTFSSLMFDVTALFGSGRTTSALLNLAGQNALGLGCVALGLLLGRAL